ncbi:glycosyltransferase [Christiangramia sabulilitoris]|uniref:Glycosyltransferase family 4 protein n=1 Tax=Christiangramia sabulilitoris TaxID=2583991 RepID=A0A550HZX6_9FLAO|nr:glycosyltransferase [Christiangramia sabulilitoris]TRO64271.1 glycosyltransferase family 4 protein [Christiangramia sabulilitoris]
MKKINFLFRRREKGVSIEELFTDIGWYINNESLNKIDFWEVPYKKINFPSLIKNILFSQKIKGLIHITGDIHYVAINPLKKTILTIHDVGSAIRGHKFEKFSKKLIWFWLPGFFVNKITVISLHTQKEVLEIMPWVKHKIVVIPNPVNTTLEYYPKRFNSQNPKILHLGTKENKNLENTILGLKDIQCTLQIVGVLSSRQKSLLQKYGVNWENYFNLPYKEIKHLYENCDIVSFISKYEGFGMPIIEAQKVGRVIITSSQASIPEVAGNGAHFVNPEDIIEIKEGFLKLINDNNYRQELIDKGSINVERFSIKSIAKKYQTLYDSLI